MNDICVNIITSVKVQYMQYMRLHYFLQREKLDKLLPTDDIMSIIGVDMPRGLKFID